MSAFRILLNNCMKDTKTGNLMREIYVSTSFLGGGDGKTCRSKDLANTKGDCATDSERSRNILQGSPTSVPNLAT
jgi:hypothetical protein